MGSVGASSRSFSDVDSRYTYMSDEDKEIVAGRNWGTRYFQSSNAFDINQDLREAADRGDTNAAIFQNKTVQAMDRNMRPINKNMDVIRLTTRSFLDRITEQAGVPDDLRGRLADAARGFRRFTEKDVNELKGYIVGGTFRESAFASSTYNPTLSDSAFRGRPVRLDITVTKGTRGMFSPTKEESEFVINRKAGQRVLDISIADGGRELRIKTKTVK